MKGLTREFSTKEKVLIVVFVIILLALCYYRFVHVPISDAITEATNEQYNLQDEETVVQAQAMRLKVMSDEVEQLKAEGVTSTQLSYNGSKAEIAFLNDVLADTMNYSLQFTSCTRNSDQIRRNFSLSFTATNYEKAKEILRNLSASPYRIKIGDLVFTKRTYSTYTYQTGIIVSGVTSTQTIDYEVTVSLSATFYETMVGGTADAGLPADSSN